MRQRQQNIKFEQKYVLVRQQNSQSDISENISDIQPRTQHISYIDLLDKSPLRSLRMEVNLNSERMENDFFIYEKKIVGGLKIIEHSLVFSRRKLVKQEVRVQAMPLKLPNKLIYFEYQCKF